MSNKTSWDLSTFFESEEAFLKALEAFKAYPKQLASYQGKLSDLDQFKEYLRLSKKMNEDLSRLYYFASMRIDLNKKDVNNASDLSKVQIALRDIGMAVSFEEPEILAMGKEKVDAFIKDNPEFDEFSFSFEKLFRGQSHVLSPDKEKLLSSYSAVLGEAGQLYSTLSLSDRGVAKCTLSDGREVEVNQANWSSLVADAKSAEDRATIFKTLYAYYDAHKATYGEIYNLGLQSQLASVRARGYKDILDLHLDGSAIPEQVFHNLVEVASQNAKPLQEYYEIRRKYLGLEKHRSYDRFIQLAKSEKKYTYDEAKQLFWDSIAAFPQDFQDKAHEVLREGFVDVYPAEGKRSGAYSNGGEDFHPYILLNFNGELDDCFTLAHESGHSIHTLYAEEAQPTLKQNYTIFVAEIASTFNEHNLLDYLLNSGTLSKQDKIFLLQKSIDEICSTFYRQTLFGQYEYEIAKLAEAGQPINYEVLSAKMIELYKTYFGIDIAEEEVKPLVWAYIPHLFYTPFYVYQYATSFTSSMLIYERVKAKEEGAFDQYLNLLRSGGSDYPVSQVKAAGVDLTTKEPYLAVIRRMEELVSDLKTLLEE
jgi:oligoendopeptidase F